MTIERVIVVPLKKARRGSNRRYVPKAITYLRKFIARHMKGKEVLVGMKLNNILWEKGITNPPRKIEVKAVKKTKDAETVYVEISTISKEDLDRFVHKGEPVKDKKKATKKDVEAKKETTTATKKKTTKAQKKAKEVKKPTAKKKETTAVKKKPATVKKKTTTAKKKTSKITKKAPAKKKA